MKMRCETVPAMIFFLQKMPRLNFLVVQGMGNAGAPFIGNGRKVRGDAFL